MHRHSGYISKRYNRNVCSKIDIFFLRLCCFMWLFFVVVVCSSEAHSRIQICQLFVPYTDHALCLSVLFPLTVCLQTIMHLSVWFWFPSLIKSSWLNLTCFSLPHTLPSAVFWSSCTIPSPLSPFYIYFSIIDSDQCCYFIQRSRKQTELMWKSQARDMRVTAYIVCACRYVCVCLWWGGVKAKLTSNGVN